MTAIMKGVRILEVAEHVFVPAASAILSDWGAEVIKIEPVERGDAARGLAASAQHGVLALYEHANRGKRSLGLDLSQPDGLAILYKLAGSSDIFLTNKVRRIRDKLKIEVDDIRVHNPDIIYVRGTGNGERGPESDKGSYDLLNFWHRSGASMGAVHPNGEVPFLPAPGFGDSLGAMTIAGGMMGALFHRLRTGQAPVVDVSLLSTGMGAMGGGITWASLVDEWQWPPAVASPLSHNYLTKDGKWLALCCLQAGRYWAPLCELLGRPELAGDPRFVNLESLMANSAEAITILDDAFSQRTLDEWCDQLADFEGQWTVVQDARQAGLDPQAIANGNI
jgi:crotonobetainyl-CoA:carnitine CoA-transferase CaiB-like acyl-CoA transferase